MKTTLVPTDALSALDIIYGSCDYELFRIHIGFTEDGICFLAFGDKEKAINDMQNLWSNSHFTENNSRANVLIKEIFQDNVSQNLIVTGSSFQLKTWQTLLKIPAGQTRSYQQIAELLGDIKLTRAAASAIAKNNISYLIPCHRVIRKSGNINKYRWGANVKAHLLKAEQ